MAKADAEDRLKKKSDGDLVLVGGVAQNTNPSGILRGPKTIAHVLVGKNLDGCDAGKKTFSLDVGMRKAIGKQVTLSTQRLTLGIASKFGNGRALASMTQRMRKMLQEGEPDQYGLFGLGRDRWLKHQ